MAATMTPQFCSLQGENNNRFSSQTSASWKCYFSRPRYSFKQFNRATDIMLGQTTTIFSSPVANDAW